MKSIKVKISNKDYNILKPYVEWYADIASQLEKNILIFAGRTATDKTGKIVLDCEAERSKICNNDESLIADCYFVYKSFVTLDSRKFASWFLGGRDKGDTSNKGRKSTKEKTQEQIEFAAKLDAALLNLENNNILPFKIDTKGIDYLEKNPTYKWAIAKEISAKLSSYEEQVLNTKTEFDELSLKLKECEHGLFTPYPEEVKVDFQSFIEDCKLNNHRVNFKFISFLKNSNGNYSTRGYWVDREDVKHRYSMKQEILDSLLKYNSIISGDNSILLSSTYADMEEYVELVSKFEYKKEIPTYTAISTETCKFLLGNNCVPFKVSHVNDQLIWTIKSPLGEKIEFVTNYKRMGKGKHFQLEQLKVTPLLKIGSLKEDGKYGITWSTNGKQPFNGVLKEPNIILRNEGMFVQLPITIDKDEKLERIRGKVRTILNRAYPVKPSSKKQKTIKIENTDLMNALKELGRPLNVLGVDLGLRGIALAYLTYNGKRESLISTNYIKGTLEERLKMAALVKKINKTKELINLTADLYKSKNTSELYDMCSDEEKLYLNSIDEFKKRGVKLHELKHRQNEWIVSNQYNDIKKEFTKLKVNRLKHYDFLNMPFWANTIKQFINISKSYLWVGMESPSKKGSPIQNAFADSTFFKTYQELYHNVHEDYAKKVANYIVTSAVKSNIDIIAVEELSSNLGHRDYKTRQDNEMFLMWNCGRIKFHIENMAKDYGILITEVSEFETSQVHYETNNYAYRDIDNNEILWYQDNNGNLKQTHADKNAAINIAMRFLSQHTNVYSYPVIKSEDNTFKLVISPEPDKDKRRKGAAFKEFKSVDIKFNANGEKNSKSRIFKVNGKWEIGKNKKDLYLESLKFKVRNNASAAV